jgi:hypothetical protein
LGNRRLDELFHIRVAANHAVERDDIGRRQCIGLLNEISVIVRQALTMTMTTSGRFALGCINVRRRRFHNNRTSEPGRQQFMRYGTNSTAEVEERFGLVPRRTNDAQQEPSGAARAALALTSEFSFCEAPAKQAFGTTKKCAALPALLAI